MPKIIDHESRKRDIAGAVLRVVAREGVRGVTIRRVAEEAGWSTGVINHFFGDKQALLHAAVREAALSIGDKMQATGRLERADDRIQALLEAGMPLDDERAATCRIFFYFWAEGIVDPKLGAELASYYAWWRAQVRAEIERAQRDGRFASFDAAELGEALVGLAEGLGVQNMFDNKAMNSKRLRARLADVIARLDTAHASREKPAHARKSKSARRA